MRAFLLDQPTRTYGADQLREFGVFHERLPVDARAPEMARIKRDRGYKEEDEVALAPDPARVRFTPGFLAPPLPAGGPGRLADARAAATALAARLGLPPGDPVDFWTEAALFSAAGRDVLVYGPGSIDQAHTAGEYVPLADLVEAATRYRAILS